MINTDYIKYLEKIFTELKESGSIASDITFGFHEEFYYEYENDVEITASTLPGQINKGLVQYPIQIRIDVVDKYVDEIKTLIDDLAVSLNETIIEIDDSEYKQFYTTSTLFSSFTNKNTKKYNSLTVSATLINYSNVLGLSTLSFDGDNVLGPLVSYSISYEADTASTGQIGNPETKSVAKTMARTWNFVFVANSSNSGILTILTQAIRGTNPNTEITMVSKFNSIDNANVSETMILKTASIDQELISTNFPLLRIILTKGV